MPNSLDQYLKKPESKKSEEIQKNRLVVKTPRKNRYRNTWQIRDF
jgi:hypothetical protein